MHEMHERFRRLVTEWRRDARVLAQYNGSTEVVELLAKHADVLEDIIDGDDELLNLTQAAKLSGYTANYLGQLVKEGKLPNLGRRNAPKLARTDVPIKPGHLPVEEEGHNFEAIASGQVLREVAGRPS